MASRKISGELYSLREIFSGENNKVVIPDLQRDYCWGNPLSEQGESLVSSFMDTLLTLDKSSDLTMGLIYGYYDDKLDPNKLQLCDGQQRLTTLFLIIGVINRMSGDDRYRKILISDFELNDDDKDPHLIYGIRESSLYFLSDLTIHYFLDSHLSFDQMENQPWFLRSYYEDPTIISIRQALQTIESKISECDDLIALGDFIADKLKFLYYDMKDRHNGEETFVVINTTGEPLSANQNLKPLIIMENPDYKRIATLDDGRQISHSTADDWEEMETWFWANRRRNKMDTSTEGMIAFLHCVRVLESQDLEEWHKNYDINDDKFPKSIKMEAIWGWFCAYKRIYELKYDRLLTNNLKYPDNKKHFEQNELYILLPVMEYCKRFGDASDTDIQRVFHLFSNMSRYRNTYRSSKNESLNVPAYKSCQIIKNLQDKDFLSLLDVSDFTVKEEIVKLAFMKQFKNDENQRIEFEELLANTENMSIFDGQIATLINWSNNSRDEFIRLNNKIHELWDNEDSQDKVRQALLAFGVQDYPMNINQTNRTLCVGTQWRTLFEKQSERILEFLNISDISVLFTDDRIKKSPYYPLINDISHLRFSQNKQIRIHNKGVIELMEKQRARAQFRLFHRGEVFEKDMVNTNHWDGFWIWSDEGYAVFYSTNKNYNITLDMRVEDNGYLIVAWLDRRPKLTTVDTRILEDIGFEHKNDEWQYPFISDPTEAKKKFIEITELFVDKTNGNSKI